MTKSQWVKVAFLIFVGVRKASFSLIQTDTLYDLDIDLIMDILYVIKSIDDLSIHSKTV